MKEYKLGDISKTDLHIYGRNNGVYSPLPLFWTASGVEVRVRASELWVEVEAGYDVYEPWISILVDHAPVSRQMVLKGRYWIPVFRSMDRETERTVRISKDVQPMSDEPGSFLKIHGFRIDGEFLPVEEKKMKIEFIGDSITSGEGTVGAKRELCWSSMVFGSVENYASITAELLDADYHIISQSGWGVLSSWDGNPKCSLPRYYEQVCGLAAAGENAAAGAGDAYDFKIWQPDVVVINLGTNDESAFSQPSVFCDETGMLFDQRLEADGSYEAYSAERLRNAMKIFLKKVRHYNGEAEIIWAYGMLGTPLKDLILAAIHEYQKDSGDNKVRFVELIPADDTTIGSREHPGVRCHRQAAGILTAEIKKIKKI